MVVARDSEFGGDIGKELGEFVSELAPKAIIRYGDYPRGGSELKITLVVSKLNRVAKIKDYYSKIPELLEVKKMQEQENETRLEEMVSASTVVPSLFHNNGE